MWFRLYSSFLFQNLSSSQRLEWSKYAANRQTWPYGVFALHTASAAMFRHYVQSKCHWAKFVASLQHILKVQPLACIIFSFS